MFQLYSNSWFTISYYNVSFFSDVIDLSNIEDSDNSDGANVSVYPSLVRVKVKLEKNAPIPRKRKNSNNNTGGWHKLARTSTNQTGVNTPKSATSWKISNPSSGKSSSWNIGKPSSDNSASWNTGKTISGNTSSWGEDKSCGSYYSNQRKPSGRRYNSYDEGKPSGRRYNSNYEGKPSSHGDFHRSHPRDNCYNGPSREPSLGWCYDKYLESQQMLQNKLERFHQENNFRTRDTGHVQRVLDTLHKKDPVTKNHYQLPFDADTPVGLSFNNTATAIYTPITDKDTTSFLKTVISKVEPEKDRKYIIIKCLSFIKHRVYLKVVPNTDELKQFIALELKLTSGQMHPDKSQAVKYFKALEVRILTSILSLIENIPLLRTNLPGKISEWIHDLPAGDEIAFEDTSANYQKVNHNNTRKKEGKPKITRKH